MNVKLLFDHREAREGVALYPTRPSLNWFVFVQNNVGQFPEKTPLRGGGGACPIRRRYNGKGLHCEIVLKFPQVCVHRIFKLLVGKRFKCVLSEEADCFGHILQKRYNIRFTSNLISSA